MSMYIRVHAYVCIYMCVYMYICIYIYICTNARASLKCMILHMKKYIKV